MCKLERNMAQCSACRQVVESTHRHDFVTCRCGRLSVDGGKAYARRCYDGPFTELSQYAACDDPACFDKDREREEQGHEIAA